MDAKFSPRVNEVLTFSREEALRLGHDYVGVEHLLLGIIREGEGMAVKILESLGVETGKLRQLLERVMVKGDSTFPQKAPPLNTPLVKQAEKALKTTHLEAKKFK